MLKTKFILAAGGILCAAGLLCSAVSLAALDFDFTRTSNASPAEEKTYTLPIEGLTQVSVGSDNMRIEVVPTQGEELRLRYYESETYSCSVSAEGGALTVQSSSHQKWYDQFKNGFFSGLDFTQYKILLELPASYEGELNLRSENASISARDLDLELLGCQTSNGPIEIVNSSAGEVSAITTNGSVKLRQVASRGALTAHNTNGGISLNGIEAGETKIENSSGSITLQDAALGSLDASNSNGKISLNQVSVSEVLTAANSNGGIWFDRLVGSDINLRTSNGKISGSIEGRESDYGILAKTTNGSNNLEDRITPADKMLHVTNSNGGIHITFTQQ